MDFTVPRKIKIYHILHIDKLPAIVDSKSLFSDSILANKKAVGSTIGMDKIKKDD